MPDCPGAQSVNQAGLELRYPPVSASQTLGLKVLATTPRAIFFLWASGDCCWVIFHGQMVVIFLRELTS